MPIILNKTKVLNGRGIVGKWGNGNCAGKFVYRERIPNTKRYRFYTMDDVTSLSEAEEEAANAAIELAQRELPENVIKETSDELSILTREERLVRRKEKLLESNREKLKIKLSIEKTIKEFLDGQWKRVQAGTFALNSYEHKKYCLYHLSDYIKWKEIKYVTQIKYDTFDDYLIFRSGTTRINQNRELAVIGEWIKSYLIRKKYIDSSLWLRGGMLPKVEIRMIDRMANPAINGEDWRTIVDYVRDHWRGEYINVTHGAQRTKRQYFRNLFWHYLLVSKGSGMSPEEVLKLKWKNIEIRDVGRISDSKAKEEINELLSVPEVRDEIEEILGDGFDTLSENKFRKGSWVSSEDEFGREERLIAYITTMRSKTKAAREIPTNLGSVFKRWVKWQKEFLRNHGYSDAITPDHYVFGNPLNEWKPVHDNRIRYNFRQVVDKLKAEGKLKGHKFSDKRYTLYSMRSTFIENHLIKGTDIFLLARIAGHDVKTLMQSYERMDIRKRAEEITHIEYGKTKEYHKEINILS